MSEVPLHSLYPERKPASSYPPRVRPAPQLECCVPWSSLPFASRLPRALPAEKNVESGTSQSTSGTSVNLRNSGFFWQEPSPLARPSPTKASGGEGGGHLRNSQQMAGIGKRWERGMRWGEEPLGMRVWRCRCRVVGWGFHREKGAWDF